MLAQATKDERYRNALEAGVNPRLGKREFCRALGISERTLDRYVADRLVPPGELVGPRKLTWRASLANLSFAELTRLAQEQAAQTQAQPKALPIRPKRVKAKPAPAAQPAGTEGA
jgi:hypothetical protein